MTITKDYRGCSLMQTDQPTVTRSQRNFVEMLEVGSDPCPLR